MKTSKPFLFRTAGIVFILIPYVLGFSSNPADTSSTTIGLAGGGGSYSVVSRDCSGRVLDIKDHPFSDLGMSIDHKISIVRIGVKAGVASISNSTVDGTLRYINPTIGIDTRYFGLQAGPLFTDEFGGSFFGEAGFRGGPTYSEWNGTSFVQHYSTVYPSGSLRLGYLDDWCFTSGLLDNLPLVSGGGLFDVGVGFHSGDNPASRLWFGLGFFPFDRAILSAKGDFPIMSNVVLNLQGNFKTGDATEYGFAIGTKIILH